MSVSKENFQEVLDLLALNGRMFRRCIADDPHHPPAVCAGFPKITSPEATSSKEFWEISCSECGHKVKGSTLIQAADTWNTEEVIRRY